MTPCTGQGAAKPCLRRRQCQRYIAFTNMAASPAPVAVYEKPLAEECWRLIPTIDKDS